MREVPTSSEKAQVSKLSPAALGTNARAVWGWTWDSGWHEGNSFSTLIDLNRYLTGTHKGALEGTLEGVLKGALTGVLNGTH